MFCKSHQGSRVERCVPEGQGPTPRGKNMSYREDQVRAPVECYSLYFVVFTTNSLSKHLSQCTNTERQRPQGQKIGTFDVYAGGRRLLWPGSQEFDHWFGEKVNIASRTV